MRIPLDLRHNISATETPLTFPYVSQFPCPYAQAWRWSHCGVEIPCHSPVLCLPSGYCQSLRGVQPTCEVRRSALGLPRDRVRWSVRNTECRVLLNATLLSVFLVISSLTKHCFSEVRWLTASELFVGVYIQPGFLVPFPSMVSFGMSGKSFRSSYFQYPHDWEPPSRKLRKHLFAKFRLFPEVSLGLLSAGDLFCLGQSWVSSSTLQVQATLLACQEHLRCVAA